MHGSDLETFHSALLLNAVPGDLPLDGLRDLWRLSRPGRGVWARVSLNDLPCLGDSALPTAASRPIFAIGLTDHIEPLEGSGGGGAFAGGLALTGTESLGT